MTRLSVVARGPDRLRPRVGEPDLLDTRHRGHHFLSGLDLPLVGQPETGSEIVDRLRDSGCHDRMPVAEDHRAQPEEIVDVGVAVDVGEPGPSALRHEQGVGLPPVARQTRG